MGTVDTSSSINQNAHKAAFLAYRYPTQTVEQIIEKFETAALDINTAFWKAEQLGLIEAPDPETKMITFVKPPATWYFGQTVEHIMEMLMFTLNILAKNEGDIEEYTFGQWVNGYDRHDVVVAIAYLLETGQIEKYVIEDDVENAGVSEYVFYTLPGNADKKWGAKQFKSNPLEKKAKKEAEEQAKDE